jgi:hypothetical protein
MNSSINFGLLPAAATTVGAGMKVGMGGAWIWCLVPGA